MTDETGPAARNWIHQASRDDLIAHNITLATEVALLTLKLRDTIPPGVHLRALAEKDEVIARYRRIVEHLRKTGAA